MALAHGARQETLDKGKNRGLLAVLQNLGHSLEFPTDGPPRGHELVPAAAGRTRAEFGHGRLQTVRHQRDGVSPTAAQVAGREMSKELGVVSTSKGAAKSLKKERVI